LALNSLPVGKDETGDTGCGCSAIGGWRYHLASLWKGLDPLSP
jgi:hypothetical protein